MFVRPGSLALSFFVHFSLFILFLFFYSNREIMVAKPVEKVLVSLLLQQRTGPSRPESEPVSSAKPTAHEIPAAAPTPEKAIKPQENQSAPPPAAEKIEKGISDEIEKRPPVSKTVQPPEQVESPLHVPDGTEVYYLSRDILLPDDDGPLLLDDAPLLEDLLIDETLAGDNNSLFSLELESAESRKILSRPEIVFDSRDPILATLENCRLSFSITKEGFVREASMISPGSGSTYYDKIIEDLLSQFLFEPGRSDNGIISIKFYRVKESEGE